MFVLFFFAKLYFYFFFIIHLLYQVEDPYYYGMHAEDPYYCGMQARVSNFSNRQRKSLAMPPVHNYIASSNNHHHLRKANSNGYLNSFLFNPTSNYYSGSKNPYYSQYEANFGNLFIYFF